MKTEDPFVCMLPECKLYRHRQSYLGISEFIHIFFYFALVIYILPVCANYSSKR